MAHAVSPAHHAFVARLQPTPSANNCRAHISARRVIRSPKRGASSTRAFRLRLLML